MFLHEKNDTNPLLASNFQLPRNSPCSYASCHYRAIQQDARTEGSPNRSQLDRWATLLSYSQNGSFHGMPERKQRLTWPFLIFLLRVCMLGWTRQSSAAGLKEWWKPAFCLWLLGKKDQGTGSWERIFTSGTSPSEHSAELEISPN